MKVAIIRGIPPIVNTKDIFNTGSSLSEFIAIIRVYAIGNTSLYAGLGTGRTRYRLYMCLWLLTACLGLLPANPVPPSNIVVVQGVPSPILVPTAAPATTAAAVTNATMPPGMPMGMPTGTPTGMPTGMPTTATTTTTAAPIVMPTPAPTTTTPRVTTGNTIPISPIMETTLTTASPYIIITTNQILTPLTYVTNMPVATGVVSVLLCSNPDVICVSNPIENTTGSLPIDPRLGTTPGMSAQYQGPPITGYSTQIQTVDTAVKFPREKREVVYDKELSVNILKLRWKNVVETHEIRKRQSCRCVPAGTCVKTTNGQGMIDIRIVTPVAQCPSGQEYCCGSTTATIACGTLQTVPATSVAPAAGQASFGEYPWQALILTKQNDYIAGGVLIDQLNVLTVTHRMSSYIVSGTAPNVKVRLGEWDAAGTYEPIAFQEYNVAKVFSHPSFNSGTLQYDITVLRLASAVPFTPATGSATTINRACLPPSATATYTGQRCWVSGWGKDMFGLQGQYQNILKEVDVPIVNSGTCQTQMQTARLGATFVLDTTSFICAGGEANKDSCTGDGGSGLVCNVNGQWVVVGLVAWGLGCANANVPAAYVNVAALLPWIQQQVATA